MSAASQLAYANLTGARALVQRVADGLRLAGGGAAVTAAAQQFQGVVQKIATEKYAKHVQSGTLAASLRVTVSGGLVQVHRLGYAKFHRWDLFRRGFGPAMLKIAGRIFSASLLGIVRGNPDFVRTAAAIGLAEAEGIEAAGAASDAKKAAAKSEAADRAYDRRIKRQEAREDRSLTRRPRRG